MLILGTVAHKIYGVPITINSANYAYFLAYQHMFNVIPSERIKDINGVSSRHWRLMLMRKQTNCWTCIADKALSSIGGNICSVLQKKSMFLW